jgi:membrane protein DedA with SNARE-associated domain
MTIDTLNLYFMHYGAIVVFVIVFLEYLNLPGFPSGVIMPLAGIWASQGKAGFALILALSIAAGLCGSWMLYAVGRFGGAALLEKFQRKFPKRKAAIGKVMDKINRSGFTGVFVGKLIPMMRTLISIPAGVLKMNFTGFTVSSVMGIAIWNLAFIGAGYIFGDSVIGFLSRHL